MFIKSLGLRGWITLPFGFLTTLTIYVTFAYIQLLINIPTYPVITIALTISTTLLLTWYALRKYGQSFKLNWKYAGIVALGLVLFVALIRQANLEKYHYDSFRYLTTGSLIATDHVDFASVNLIRKRLSPVAFLHAPANLDRNFFFASLSPLISLSVLVILGWLIRELLEDKISPKTLRLLLCGGILLLATNPGYIWHSFYINGHLLFGAYCLVFGGLGLLLHNAEKKQRLVLGLILALAIAGMVYSREEGPLLACAIALPVLFSKQLGAKLRTFTGIGLSLSILLKQGVLLMEYHRLTGELSMPILIQLMLGVAVFGVLVFTRMKLWAFIQSWSLGLAEGMVWAALGVLYLRHPSVLKISLDATWQNLVRGSGGWGLSIILMGVLVLLCVLLIRFRDFGHLRFPVTVFVPLAFVLAYTRDGAYRVGVTDSLNRMWVQLLPLAVLYVLVSIGSHATLRINKARKST